MDYRIIRVERVSDRVTVDLVIGEQITKEEFWRHVEGVIMSTDINQEVIIGGDMNGHIGQIANGFREPMETLAMVQEMQKVREF